MESRAAAAGEALDRHGLRGPPPRGWNSSTQALVKARARRDGAERSPGTLAQIELATDLLARLHAMLDPWLSGVRFGPGARRTPPPPP